MVGVRLRGRGKREEGRGKREEGRGGISSSPESCHISQVSQVGLACWMFGSMNITGGRDFSILKDIGW